MEISFQDYIIMQATIFVVIIMGSVAYDVENAEWVMFIEDKFVLMES